MSEGSNSTRTAFTYLSCNIFTTIESLGNQFASKIAGRPITVFMPAIGTEGGRIVSLAPKVDRLSSDDLFNAMLMRGGSMWARFILGGDGPPYQPHIASVSMLGVRADLRTADITSYEAIRRLERRADDWWAAVTSWIEVLSGQDIKQIGPARQLWHSGTHVQFFPLNEGERSASAVSAATPEVTGVADSTQLRASFIHAGNDQLPPDEWLFLRDARSLYRAGEYRRALIDAGSAAEVALSRIVENELRKKGESADYIATKLSAMDRLTLGQKTGFVVDHLRLRALPRNFKSVVVDKRNHAVHLRPTRKIDAERAIAKTAKLVARATPLASLTPPT